MVWSVGADPFHVWCLLSAHLTSTGPNMDKSLFARVLKLVVRCVEEGSALLHNFKMEGDCTNTLITIEFHGYPHDYEPESKRGYQRQCHSSGSSHHSDQEPLSSSGGSDDPGRHGGSASRRRAERGLQRQGNISPGDMPQYCDQNTGELVHSDNLANRPVEQICDCDPPEAHTPVKKMDRSPTSPASEQDTRTVEGRQSPTVNIIPCNGQTDGNYENKASVQNNGMAQEKCVIDLPEENPSKVDVVNAKAEDGDSQTFNGEDRGQKDGSDTLSIYSDFTTEHSDISLASGDIFDSKHQVVIGEIHGDSGLSHSPTPSGLSHTPPPSPTPSDPPSPMDPHAMWQQGDTHAKLIVQAPCAHTLDITSAKNPEPTKYASIHKPYKLLANHSAKDTRVKEHSFYHVSKEAANTGHANQSCPSPVKASSLENVAVNSTKDNGSAEQPKEEMLKQLFKDHAVTRSSDSLDKQPPAVHFSPVSSHSTTHQSGHMQPNTSYGSSVSMGQTSADPTCTPGPLYASSSFPSMLDQSAADIRDFKTMAKKSKFVRQPTLPEISEQPDGDLDKQDSPPPKSQHSGSGGGSGGGGGSGSGGGSVAGSGGVPSVTESGPSTPRDDEASENGGPIFFDTNQNTVVRKKHKTDIIKFFKRGLTRSQTDPQIDPDGKKPAKPAKPTKPSMNGSAKHRRRQASIPTPPPQIAPIMDFPLSYPYYYRGKSKSNSFSGPSTVYPSVTHASSMSPSSEEDKDSSDSEDNLETISDVRKMKQAKARRSEKRNSLKL